MDKTVFSDKVNDAVLLGDLHGYREVVGCLGWEEDIDCLFSEDGVRSVVINLDDVQLKARKFK